MARATTLEERVEIAELARAGMNDRQISESLGWSKETVRKWRRRERLAGRAGLACQMGRPKRGALSSFPRETAETLLRWRKENPGWGLVTLYCELKRHPAFVGKKIPSYSSIGRFLHEQEVTRSYQRHSELPESGTPKAEAPHAVWEMDARGHGKIPDVGVVSLIDLNDRYSHIRLLCYPCQVGQKRWERHPNTDDYQLVLRLAFTDWGLPERLQVDRASVFYDNTSKSPFPTRLHLWLLALGVTMTLGRPRQPRDQAMTERSHQLWYQQSILGHCYSSWDSLYLALRQRRDFLNQLLPCASLDGQPPLKAFPQAARSFRPYRPEWEAELLDLDRIYTYLAHSNWFRLVSKDGNVSIGKQIFSVGRKYARQQIELTFQASERCFLCFDQSGQLIKKMPAWKITKDVLLGDWAKVVSLPFFQLALPFEGDAQRVVRLFETMPGTT